MSTFWSLWIIILTVVTIIALVWLLLATRKIKNPRTDNTTGHVYDGIVEEDNPLPAWWFWMFILSVVFSVGYLVAYPGLGSFSGVLGWSSIDEHDRAARQVDEAFSASVAEFANDSLQELALNPKANNMGKRLFATNCSVCHGQKGEGGFGFPTLSDAEWQWGGTEEQILHSIKHGRQAAMVAWKDVLGPQKLPQVVSYVRSMSGAADDMDPAAVKLGKEVFTTYCASCHSADGSGNALVGAPSLVDDVWLYGGSEEQIYMSVSAGRSGQMPAHNSLLSDAKINLLAAYVLSLSKAE